MAKNWTMAEATKAIVDGTNDAALQDLGRRFPLTTVKIAQIGAKAPEITELMAAFPSHMTVRKIESTLKDGVEEIETEDIDEETEPEEKPAKAKKAPAKMIAKAKAEEEDDEDEGEYAGMSAMDLYKECKNRGIKAAAKKPAKYYVDLLEKDDASGDDDDWDDEPEEKPASKAAKKPAAKKAAKKAEPEDDDDDDEWDI